MQSATRLLLRQLEESQGGKMHRGLPPVPHQVQNQRYHCSECSPQKPWMDEEPHRDYRESLRLSSR